MTRLIAWVRMMRKALCALMMTLLSCGVCSAQTGQGTIAGSVSDQKGAYIQGAEVMVVNEGTSEQRRTKSAVNGTFTVPLLPPAVYDVQVSYAGFRTERREGIQLTADGTSQVTVVLQVGQVNENIDVKAQ